MTGHPGSSRASAPRYPRGMKIKARDGKTYEVRQTGSRETFEVHLGSDHVATFVIDEDKTHVTITAAGQKKTREATIREVADEFVDRGGAPMGMMGGG